MPVRLVDDIVESYRQVVDVVDELMDEQQQQRRRVKRRLSQEPSSSGVVDEEHDGIVLYAQCDRCHARIKTNNKRNQPCLICGSEMTVHHGSQAAQDDAPKPDANNNDYEEKTKIQAKRGRDDESNNNNNNNDAGLDEDDDGNKLPVFKNEFESNNNANGDAADVRAAAQIPRQRLAKKAYNLLKIGQLRDLCREQGLAATGTEQELQWRHMQWVIFYNANLDRAIPKPLDELREELKTLEKARKQGSKPKVFGKTASKAGASSGAVDWSALVNKAAETRAAAAAAAAASAASMSPAVVPSSVAVADDSVITRSPPRKIASVPSSPVVSSSAAAPPNDNAPKEEKLAAAAEEEPQENGEVKVEPERLGMFADLPPQWQVVWSDVLNKPFFFNTETLFGTFNFQSNKN